MTDISAPFAAFTGQQDDPAVQDMLGEIVAQMRQAASEGRLVAAAVVLGVMSRGEENCLVANSVLVVDPRTSSEALTGLAERAQIIADTLDEKAGLAED